MTLIFRIGALLCGIIAVILLLGVFNTNATLETELGVFVIGWCFFVASFIVPERYAGYPNTWHR